MTDVSVVPEPEAADDGRRRPKWLVAVVAGGIAVVLVAAGLVGTRVLGVWGADEPAASPQPSPTATEPVDPFAGTPAEDFAEGAAGIVLPEAEAVGEFTAEEVADALEQVRDALIAARLDTAMLIDHDPDPLLALLAADHRPVRQAEFGSDGSVAYATQIADEAALAASPRVYGQVSYGTKTVEGDLPIIEVVTAFVWVYAFELPGTEPHTSIVVIRDELTWEMADERWLESSQGLWIASSAAAVWGLDCKAHDEGLVRPTGEQAADLGDDTDPMFDLQQSPESLSTC